MHIRSLGVAITIKDGTEEAAIEDVGEAATVFDGAAVANPVSAGTPDHGECHEGRRDEKRARTQEYRES